MIEGTCLCGALRWEFDGVPPDATACNCTACRRYGTLWAYDWDGHGIRTFGETRAFVRPNGQLGFHFCPGCGCVAWWRGLKPRADGRTRIAVNLRLADPAAVAEIPVEHFDGLDSFKDLGRDGRCVRDMWF